jgi:hypothetical protein
MGKLDMINGCILFGTHGKSPLGRHKYRWKDEIKIYLKKWGIGVWIEFV